MIVGRVAKTPIKSATPIKANQLYQPGELPPLEVAEGMRAVSVEVGDGVAMVDGMIKPGQYVDILFTSQGSGTLSDNTFQGGLTMRLFEGVKILAINRNYTQSRVERGSNHVTLELTEAQANIVVLARKRGRLTLTYNPSNTVGNGGLALSNSERVTFYEILGLRKQDPAKEPFQTEIFRGNSNRSVNTYDDRGRFMGSNYTAPPPTNNNPQYVMPNDAGAKGAGADNTNRNNAPAPNSNQPARTQGQPINNGNGPRTPTAALPAGTLN